MPGALVILAVFAAIAVVAWLAAWTYLRNPANHNPREDYRQLQRHAAWLEQRLDQARQEHWGSEMINRLSNELGDACQQLGRTRGGVLFDRAARHR